MLKNTTAAKFNLLFSLTSVIIMLLCIIAKKNRQKGSRKNMHLLMSGIKESFHLKWIHLPPPTPHKQCTHFCKHTLFSP